MSTARWIQPIAALSFRADTAQFCQPCTWAHCTGLARLRGIGPLAEGGDWLAPEYTTSLGGPPSGACGCPTVWALCHAVHQTRLRGCKTKHLMARGGGSRANAGVKTHQRALAAFLGC